MEDVISETGRRLGQVKNPEDPRSQAAYLVDHSPTMKLDVNEVWEKLQSARLHRDRRVVAANMRAAKIVSELLVLLAVFPELIEGSFFAEHQRLWNGEYLKFYRDGMGPKIRVSRELLAFLPLDRFIGEDHRLGDSGVDIEVEHLVLAKDFVASLTDDQARKLHSNLLGSQVVLR